MHDLLRTAGIARAQSLPDSKTHRLTFFPGGPEGGKYLPVENLIADEVEEYREFVKFLFPKGGQNLFKLCAPDILELRWSVYDRDTQSTYAYGHTPLEAARAARIRLNHERQPVQPLTLDAP